MKELVRNWRCSYTIIKRANILGTACFICIIICKPVINHLPVSVCSVLCILSWLVLGTSLRYFAVVGLSSCLPKLCQFVQSVAYDDKWMVCGGFSLLKPSSCQCHSCECWQLLQKDFLFLLNVCLKLILTVLKRLLSSQRVLQLGREAEGFKFCMICKCRSKIETGSMSVCSWRVSVAIMPLNQCRREPLRLEP